MQLVYCGAICGFDIYMETEEVRRAKLRRIAERDFRSKAAFAKAIDKSPAYVNQLIGPNPSRPITRSAAREYEEKLGLKAGELDYLDGSRELQLTEEGLELAFLAADASPETVKAVRDLLKASKR